MVAWADDPDAVQRKAARELDLLGKTERSGVLHHGSILDAESGRAAKPTGE
jgi:hypothetical protein